MQFSLLISSLSPGVRLGRKTQAQALLGREFLLCCSGGRGGGGGGRGGVTLGREEDDSLGYRAHDTGLTEGGCPDTPQ